MNKAIPRGITIIYFLLCACTARAALDWDSNGTAAGAGGIAARRARSRQREFWRELCNVSFRYSSAYASPSP